MRFLGYTLANEAETPTEPPSPDLYEKMGRFVEEASKAGVIVATGGIAPRSEGARISLKDGGNPRDRRFVAPASDAGHHERLPATAVGLTPPQRRRLAVFH